jgi:hypothetical protein
MSAKTTADKLLIKPDSTVWASDPARLALVDPLPAGVREAGGPSDATTALVFAEDSGSLRSVLTAHSGDLHAPEVFWVVYPKGQQGGHQPRQPVADPLRARHAADQPGRGRRDMVGAALPPVARR